MRHPNKAKRKRAEKRRRAAHQGRVNLKCPNCGESIQDGGHFAPPGFGSPGAWICTKVAK